MTDDIHYELVDSDNTSPQVEAYYADPAKETVWYRRKMAGRWTKWIQFRLNDDMTMHFPLPPEIGKYRKAQRIRIYLDEML